MITIKRFAFIFLAVAVGIGAGVYRIADVEHSSAFFTNGCWKGSKNLPLGKDNLLTAQVTAFALFALPGTEAIYLVANKDERKERLNSTNDYSIEGNIHQIRAKYWSITAYGTDLYLIPNENNRYAFNNSNLKTDSAGNFIIHLSHKPKADNWLPTPKNAKFNLVLRIYRGESDFFSGLEKSSLPTIKNTNAL
ncbi:MAG: DUF1214 domain-containing protein [Bacteroidetes bacterium]|nr:DUF1214 domain-containing protein [Bacteroidota bacterium]